MDKKQKIILIIVILLLVVSVLGLGGYIIYDKVINKGETKNNLANNPEEYNFTEIELSECFRTWPEDDEHTINCEDTIEANNKPVTIKLIGKNLLNDEESSYISKIFVNKKEIFSTYDFLGIDKLLIIDDTLIFYTNEGTFIKNGFLTYSLTNKKPEMIYELDDEIPYMYVYLENAKTIKNRLYVTGSRFTDPAGVDPNVFVNDKNSEQIMVSSCYPADMKKHGINNDSIVEASYVIEYLGKNKFSINRIKETTLNEMLDMYEADVCETLLNSD